MVWDSEPNQQIDDDDDYEQYQITEENGRFYIYKWTASEGVLTERSEFVALFDTEDKEIGVQAFLERKNAEWVGN